MLPVTGGDALLSVNPDTPRNPASTIKLVTTLAALETLNPAYVWPTEVYLDGKLANGVLNGNLVIKGHGDPYFLVEDMWKMLRSLRREGLQRITGDLVIDASHFDLPPYDAGRFDGQPLRAYNVGADAFLVNYKAVRFHFFANGNGVRIATEPELPNLKIDNRLKLGPGRCGGYQRGIAMQMPDPVEADRVVFSGTFPRACGRYAMLRTALTPASYAFGLFMQLWQEVGGEFSGTLKTGIAPTGKRPFLTWYSKSLADAITAVNKYSNNVMTRHLLLTLGAETAGAPATPAAGIAAIDAFLSAHGLDTSSLVIANGAGLSRDTRISARLLADTMQLGFRSTFAAEYISSMSVAGLDGTTKRRFRGRQEAGFMHVKTGRLDSVSAIAGFVQARSGRRFIVVGMLNHANAHRGPGEELMNGLLRWAYRQ